MRNLTSSYDIWVIALEKQPLELSGEFFLETVFTNLTARINMMALHFNADYCLVASCLWLYTLKPKHYQSTSQHYDSLCDVTLHNIMTVFGMWNTSQHYDSLRVTHFKLNLKTFNSILEVWAYTAHRFCSTLSWRAPKVVVPGSSFVCRYCSKGDHSALGGKYSY